MKSSTPDPALLSKLFTQIETISDDSNKLERKIKYMRAFDSSEKSKNGLVYVVCNSYERIFTESIIQSNI